MATTPPRIFDPVRRAAIRRRMAALQARTDAPRYLIGEMVEDVLERLAFLRIEPGRALVVGDWTGDLGRALAGQGFAVTATDPVLAEVPLQEEQPYPEGGFDLAVSLCTLDTVNDLPGALVHLRATLAPGGLMIACFPAAGSLAKLRRIMLAAEPERPAARMHPMVDTRAGAELLQRAGFADPVVDSHALDVRFSTLLGLVADLRAQGLSAALADRAPMLGRPALARAQAEFVALADPDGKLAERFEILTLSGWRKS
ncbi:class I SAM-dependent methyltransferase [Pseudoblastomonas flavescens]|uniref:class I SAM-dependent methyltransferase n=2 Tax=Alteriqipengyuania flavescens TaxID=3053610 RepID=UPI0025B48C99|nr:class I SAM-dependent methyltransferase [Alteriqipengyuania flavescens]WJY18292.1 class I SAM-dependent methyltransferase [Alteriqipengyuania flavescens]